MRRESWLVLLPRRLPALSLILEDIGNPSPSVVAKSLGVHVRTVERWRREDKAPRPVLLALYFATRWGRSAVNCAAENDASLYFGYVAALRTQLEEAQAQLARLGQIGEFGSANDPAQGVATASTTPPAAGPTAEENRSEPSAVDPVSPRETARFSQSN